jgi:hypothetical protein
MPQAGDAQNAGKEALGRPGNPGATTQQTVADQPPEAGKRPPQAAPDPGIGEIGTGAGYSGQEYDSKGQQAWREQQATLIIDPSGQVHGSGAGAGGGSEGEDYDSDSAAGSGGAPTGAPQ